MGVCLFVRAFSTAVVPQALLDEWSPALLASFVKVMPTDYKRVVEAQQAAKKLSKEEIEELRRHA